MERILLTLGDSWPEGAELGNGRRYGEILADRWQRQLYNYGSGGASNEDLLYQLQDYVEHHHRASRDVIVIAFLTNPSRTAHWPRGTSWQPDPSWPDDVKRYFKTVWLHFHDPRREIMRSSATITAMQTWCQKFGFRDYYFAGWNRYERWLPGVNLDKIWAQGKETVADWFGAAKHNGEHLLDVGQNPYIYPNKTHPNQLGHNLIADKLDNWIKSTPA